MLFLSGDRCLSRAPLPHLHAGAEGHPVGDHVRGIAGLRDRIGDDPALIHVRVRLREEVRAARVGVPALALGRAHHLAAPVLRFNDLARLRGVLVPLHATVPHGMGRPAEIRLRGMARRGMARRGMARRGRGRLGSVPATAAQQTGKKSLVLDHHDHRPHVMDLHALVRRRHAAVARLADLARRLPVEVGVRLDVPARHPQEVDRVQGRGLRVVGTQMVQDSLQIGMVRGAEVAAAVRHGEAAVVEAGVAAGVEGQTGAGTEAGGVMGLGGTARLETSGTVRRADSAAMAPRETGAEIVIAVGAEETGHPATGIGTVLRGAGAGAHRLAMGTDRGLLADATISVQVCLLPDDLHQCCTPSLEFNELSGFDLPKNFMILGGRDGSPRRRSPGRRSSRSRCVEAFEIGDFATRMS